MEASSFKVKTDTFEGPLELLLTLIEKRKLLVNDISLATVADDYIEHIKTFQEFPMRDAANFILIAATLVLIKSRSLLPQLELSHEEQSDIDTLEMRLKLYKRMKELARHVHERFGHNILFAKSEQHIEVVFAPDKGLTISGMKTAMKEVLGRLPKIENIPETIVEKVLSLEETIEHLTERIQSGLKLRFSEFSKTMIAGKKQGREEKVNLIIGFLAMLELVKQGIITVTQECAFRDINMETKSTNVPDYTQ